MPSFEYIKENKTVKLNDKLARKLAVELTGKQERFDKLRQRQIDDANKLRGVLFRDAISDIKFNDVVDTDSIYELHESVRANLRKYIDTNVENFAVFGRDEASHKNAPVQKESIIYSLRDMEFKEETKRILDDFLISGELISFTGWYEKVRQVRRKKTEEEQIIDEITGILTNQKVTKIAIEEELAYEGPKCYAVPFDDFVYDVYAKDFDSAIKIQKKYLTYDDIKAEKNFKLDEEADKALNPLKAENETKGDGVHESEEAERERGKVKLYECWGDIRLQDGTMLRNYLVVIANDRHIIRFESNPYVRNPFTIKKVLTDCETKRGVSMLKVALGHSAVSSYILSRMLNILELIQNPPWLGPEGAMTETGEVEWQPGRYYGFDEWSGANAPQPVKFDSTVIDFKFLEYFKAVMQSTTGIFPYMAGIQDESNRTATEAKVLVNGQQVRMMMVVDEIQDFLLEIISKVAELNANYKFEEEPLPQLSDDGEYKEMVVNPEVRQGNYKYDYTDRRSFFEKQQEADKFLMGIQEFGKLGVPVNGEEAFKFYLENQEIKNVDRFIQIDPVQEQFNRLSPEEQAQYKPMVAEMLKNEIDMQEAMNGQGEENQQAVPV